MLLIFVQLDFRNALLDSSLELLRQIDADILVVSKNKRPFLARKSIRAFLNPVITARQSSVGARSLSNAFESSGLRPGHATDVRANGQCQLER